MIQLHFNTKKLKIDGTIMIYSYFYEVVLKYANMEGFTEPVIFQPVCIHILY